MCMATTKRKRAKRRKIPPGREAIARAISLMGGQSSAARLLKVSQVAVWQWIHRIGVPAERCAHIEAATNGQVTCQELRPDVFRAAKPPAAEFGRSRQDGARRSAKPPKRTGG